MGALEITLILVGLLIIAVSYYVSEKAGSEEGTIKELETVEDYEQRKNVEKDLKKKLLKISEEVVSEAEASLCKLSNEKIMAVNEYGDTVIDRIDKNHSEVVFLYSMLTDKEKELKELVMGSTVVDKEDVRSKLDKIESEMVNTFTESDQLVEDSFARLDKSQAKVLNESKAEFKEELEDVSYDENHKQILALYKNGKSIREISRELNLGQGEVQLVVNMHAGGK